MLATCLLIGSLSLDLTTILASSKLDGALVGVSVVDSRGQVLFEKNGQMRAVPASNQKIFSTLYAVSTLGPEFKPKTNIYDMGNGAWLVDAQGHPGLTSIELKDAGKKLGIKAGDRVMIRASFSTTVPPTWENDDLPYYYAPRVAPLMPDGGMFELYAENGSVIPPQIPGVSITRGTSRGELKVNYNPNTGRIYVSGALPRTRTRLDRLAQPDPLATVAYCLNPKSVYVPTSQAVPNKPAAWSLTGKPIKTLIKECLEPSDNALAEQLLLLAAAKSNPLTRDDVYGSAAKRMKDFFVNTVRLSPIGFSPVDGSGMSRHNMTTASSVTTALSWAEKQPWFPEFLLALAAPGEGTMQNRLANVRFEGKTGTLSAMTCLSGYVTGSNGERLKISLLMNNTAVPASEVRAVQDEIIKRLARYDLEDSNDYSTELPQGSISNTGTSPLDGYRIFRSRDDSSFAPQRTHY